MNRHAQPAARRAVSPWELHTLEARFARRIVDSLDAASASTAPEVDERLRVARENAVARARARRVTQVAADTVSNGSGTLTASGGPQHRPSMWQRLAAWLPLLLLIGGLLTIQHYRIEAQIRTAAEIDAALLADDLPPSAYADPGFIEFLKQRRGE